jgi:hypothetical protein
MPLFLPSPTALHNASFAALELWCAADSTRPATSVDFSLRTNPLVAMEWTDAQDSTYVGQAIIPTQTTDMNGGAFPHGSVRWQNVGSAGEVTFDLLVTVADHPTLYSDLVDVEYHNPLSPSASQAMLTSSGFACLGIGLQRSSCASGSALDSASSECIDGTPTTMRGAEFQFELVEAGTTTQMPAFERMFATFYDVDGDVERGGAVRELVALVGATSGLWLDSSSSLEAGVFLPSQAWRVGQRSPAQ